MIITIFILTSSWINLGWPSQLVTRAFPGSIHWTSFKTIFILTLIHIDSQSNPWPGPSPRSTLESDFKIIIVIIFILTLTQVNGQLDLWPRLGHGSTLVLGFKYDNNHFILTLTQVNGQTDSWPRPNSELTLKSGFKTIIIIIFILMLTQVNGQF